MAWRPAGSSWRSLAFTLLLVLALVAGRWTHPELSDMSLVWPAAGVGVWWLSSTRGRYELGAALLLLSAATVTVNLVTDVPPVAAVLFGPVNAAQALTGALVLRRLLPGLPGLKAPGDVIRVLAAAGAAVAVGGTLSTLVVTQLLGVEPGPAMLLFSMRNGSAVFVVMATVLALREVGLREALGRHRLELFIGSFPASALFLFLFAVPGEASALFLAMVVPVWLGTRLGVGATAVVGGALCLMTVLLTMLGFGSLATIEDDTARAVLVQAFVTVLTLVGLSLATLKRANDEVTLRLEQSRRELQQVADAAVIGKAVVVRGADGGWRLTRPNPALVRLLGQDPSGMRWRELLFPQDSLVVRAAIDRVADGLDEAWEGEVRHCLPAGGSVWTQLHVSRMPSDDRTTAVVAQVLDITERRAAQEELSRLALHDALTGLPNRAQLRARLEDLLVDDVVTVGPTPERHPSVVVAFVDLDGFKQVNDTFGHEIGDSVLQAVADRLQAALRPEDVVGRLGGDEFVACCPGVSDVVEAEQLVRRLTATLAPALLVRGRDVGLGVSVGWTLSRPGDDSASLLRRSDEAMYSAKRAGKGCIVGDPVAVPTPR